VEDGEWASAFFAYQFMSIFFIAIAAGLCYMVPNATGKYIFCTWNVAFPIVDVLLLMRVGCSVFPINGQDVYWVKLTLYLI
jgi:hypothetical protein